MALSIETLVLAKGYANKVIAEIGSGFRAKGTVLNYSKLPETADAGDVYITRDNGKAYAWIGSVWQQLSLETDAVIARAASYSLTAGNYATQAGNKAVEAINAATEAKSVVWKGTQAQYNALTTINPDTIYFIVG